MFDVAGFVRTEIFNYYQLVQSQSDKSTGRNPLSV